MTPQLRQAIKLLQFSNMEVAAFVDEEIERNPLLDRDERSEIIGERPAQDMAERPVETAASADLVSAATLPEAADSPLDHEFDGYEAAGPADGHHHAEPRPPAAVARRISNPTIVASRIC